MTAIRRCHNSTPYVQLTFDDEGSPSQIRSLVGTLNRHNVRGTFFLTGSWARDNAGMMRYILSNGHLLANHTANHAKLTQISDAAVLREIDGGVPATTSPMLLRPPFGAGAMSKRLVSLAARKGYKICFWTVDSRDWEGHSAQTITGRIVGGDSRSPRAEAGGVVLMHAQRPNTAAALPSIIQGLRARGLQLEPRPAPTR